MAGKGGFFRVSDRLGMWTLRIVGGKFWHHKGGEVFRIDPADGDKMDIVAKGLKLGTVLKATEDEYLDYLDPKRAEKKKAARLAELAAERAKGKDVVPATGDELAPESEGEDEVPALANTTVDAPATGDELAPEAPASTPPRRTEKKHRGK